MHTPRGGTWYAALCSSSIDCSHLAVPNVAARPVALLLDYAEATACGRMFQYEWCNVCCQFLVCSLGAIKQQVPCFSCDDAGLWRLSKGRA